MTWTLLQPADDAAHSLPVSNRVVKNQLDLDPLETVTLHQLTTTSQSDA